jgi:hypothetical protein
VGPTGVTVRGLLGYLAGIVLGTLSITLLFLGMRAVMDVGGACADGGPYVSAQPCPTGVPAAMVGGMFGLFASAGLLVWFGSRLDGAATWVVALGWPALFLALGFNFLDYAFHPPDGEATPVWGWLVPGIVFWLMGGAPLVVGLAAWREVRAGRSGNRLSQSVATSPIAFARRAGRPAPGPSPAMAPDPAATPIERVEFTRHAWSAPQPLARTELAGAAAATDDLVADLTRLADLHAAGDLTDAEFVAAKRELLDAAEADR